MAAPNIVSVATIIGESQGFQLGTTLNTELLTVASGKLVKINRISVANIDGTVPADAVLVLTDTPIYLEEGDKLEGGASAASDLTLFVSYEVIDD
jgi:hypothetical protein